MTKNTGGPAFPCQKKDTDDQNYGMTLRDYFAAKAMPYFLETLNACEPDNYRIAAIGSYKVADAMLAEREK